MIRRRPPASGAKPRRHAAGSVGRRSRSPGLKKLSRVTVETSPGMSTRRRARVRIAARYEQPGGLRLADGVLDPGVLAVAQFQARELTGHDPVGRVGDKPGDAVSV